MQNRMSLSPLPESLKDGLRQYTSVLIAIGKKSKAAMTDTAVKKFGASGLGGPTSQKGKKAPDTADKFLATQPIEALNELVDAVKRGCEEILGDDPRGKSKYAHYANDFVKYGKDKKWVVEETAANANQEDHRRVLRFQEPPGKRRASNGNYSVTNLGNSEVIALGTKEAHYVFKDGKKILGNETLEKELDDLANHLKQKTKIDERILADSKRILGYEHKVNKIPLKKLSLTKIIPFTKMRFSESDFPDDPDFALDENQLPLFPEKVNHWLCLQEGLAKRRVEQQAEAVDEWCDNFFTWSDQERCVAGEPDGLAGATKKFFIGTLIHIAKFQYRKETRRNDYSDIEIIVKLREKRANITVNLRKRRANIKRRCCTWHEAGKVLELQKERADARHRNKLIQRSTRLVLALRSSSQIAIDIQAFLIIALLMLLPSDRQQTLRRLKYVESLPSEDKLEGAYLILGEWVENEFVPRKEMRDPRLAQWWLLAVDFKTNDTFDVFLYPIPNQEFRDKTKFYDYLEMWLFGFDDHKGKWLTYFKTDQQEWHSYYKGENATWQGYIDTTNLKDSGIKSFKKGGWRAALEPNHDFLFTKPQAHKSYADDASCFADVVRGVFIRFTPQVCNGKIIPVTPHSFRYMLALYTALLKITPEQEKSMAFCEHHSVEIRRGTYTFYQNMHEIADAVELMGKINDELFLGKKQK